MWEERAPNNIHGNDRPNTIVVPKNGFTDKDRAKLNSIEEGAQVNKIDHITIDGKVAKTDPDTHTVITDLVSTERVDRDVNTLNNAIADEAIERNRVDQEIINSTNTEIERLDKRIDDLEQKHSEDVEIEKARAMAAEAVLTSDLAAEVRRASLKEAELADDLLTETNRALQAEADLRADLAAEIARAELAEEALSERLTVKVEDWALFIWDYPTILDNAAIGEAATLNTTVLK